MNRRSFFKLFGAGAATLALSEAIPFGRVWSFPSKIVVPENQLLTINWITMETLRILKSKLEVSEKFCLDWEREFVGQVECGELTTIPMPQSFAARHFDLDLIAVPA